FDAAFLAHFAFDQTDPAVANITAAEMKDFISELETSFAGADWEANWSNASNENMQSRISPSEVVQSSSNTNTAGMRSMALGLVIGYELLALDIPETTRKVVNDAAIDHISQGISGVD